MKFTRRGGHLAILSARSHRSRSPAHLPRRLADSLAIATRSRAV